MCLFPAIYVVASYRYVGFLVSIPGHEWDFRVTSRITGSPNIIPQSALENGEAIDD